MGSKNSITNATINNNNSIENINKKNKNSLVSTEVIASQLANISPILSNPASKDKSFRSSVFNRNSLKSLNDCSRNSTLQKLEEPTPHLFKLVLQVIDNLISKKKNQVILISGESGAGKTESAKNAIKFITKYFETSKKSRKSIINFENKTLAISLEQQIQKCNPILEAFGNTKTKNNDNSSRFGKFINLKINPEKNLIEGAEMLTFLLEKTRLIQPSLNERNFHIFYFLLKGADDQLIELLNLKRDPSFYNYLSASKCFAIENVKDDKMFFELVEAFVFNGFNNDELMYIFRILAAILNIGNIDFEENKNTENKEYVKETVINQDNSNFLQIKNCEEIITNISMLIDCDKKKLVELLTCKFLKIQQEEFKKPLNKAEALNIRDILAKEIYYRLFNWLVKKLNFNLMQQYKADKPQKFINYNENKNNITKENVYNIGILDIFGFENFDENSFEQLCINFSNEKLQQLFILDIFKNDEQEFINEGLENFISSFTFKDNKEIIDLFERERTGIFNILDDASRLKQQDSSFYQNLLSMHSTNKYFKYSKINKNIFSIVHSAKTIDYTITGFVNKNMDDTNSAIINIFLADPKEDIPLIALVFFNCLSESEYKEYLELQEDERFQANNSNSNANNQNKSKNSVVTINSRNEANISISSKIFEPKFLGLKFRKDFESLISEIKQADRYYIRCLKPNEVKKKDLLNSACLFRQINYLGILDSINIRKQNYPIRKSFQDFLILCYELYELLFFNWIWINKNKIKPEEIILINQDILFANLNKSPKNSNSVNNQSDNAISTPNNSKKADFSSEEEIQKYRKISILILEFFFSESNLTYSNNTNNNNSLELSAKYYLIGRTKLFFIDTFLLLIENTKQIYSLTKANNANKIANCWIKYKLKEKYKLLIFRIGMFAIKSFLIKKHYPQICRKNLKNFISKNISRYFDSFLKIYFIRKGIQYKIFINKAKMLINKKHIFSICHSLSEYILEKSSDEIMKFIRKKCAIKIQKNFRGLKARLLYNEYVIKGKERRLKILISIQAIKIQKSFRLYFIYKKVKNILNVMNKMKKAFVLAFCSNRLKKRKFSCEIIKRNFKKFKILKEIITERLFMYYREEQLFYESKKQILLANDSTSNVNNLTDLNPNDNFYTSDFSSNANNNETRIHSKNAINNSNRYYGSIISTKYETKYFDNNNKNYNYYSKKNFFSSAEIFKNYNSKHPNSISPSISNKAFSTSGLGFGLGQNLPIIQDYSKEKDNTILPIFDYYGEPKILLFIKVFDFDQAVGIFIFKILFFNIFYPIFNADVYELIIVEIPSLIYS